MIVGISFILNSWFQSSMDVKGVISSGKVGKVTGLSKALSHIVLSLEAILAETGYPNNQVSHSLNACFSSSSCCLKVPHMSRFFFTAASLP
jgi:hypothetical protein